MKWRDLGGIEAGTLAASRFKLDGGAMFGQVPKPLWSRFSKADEQNRIPLIVRLLLLRTSERLILVDTGTGTDYDPQSLKRLALDPEGPELSDLLQDAGLDARQFTDLVATHLHFDHIGGVGCSAPSGDRRPVLPRARVWVQADHWARAQRPGPKEVRSFRAEDLEVLRQMPLELVGGEREIAPGIVVRPSRGHTDGLQMVIAAGSREVLYYPSDLIPTLAHIRSAYTMGYDMWPDRLIEEKEALLAEIAERDGLLVFVHDPATCACRVKRGVAGFVVASKEIL